MEFLYTFYVCRNQVSKQVIVNGWLFLGRRNFLYYVMIWFIIFELACIGKLIDGLGDFENIRDLVWVDEPATANGISRRK